MLNWLDWVIVAIVIISSLISLKRGFLKEALSLASWSAAIFIAINFRPQLAAMLAESISSEALRQLSAFLLLFIATLIVGSLINLTISQLLKVTGLKMTDRIIGVVFGVTRGALIVMLCVMLAPSVVTVEETVTWQQSMLIPHFSVVEEWVYQVVPDFDRFQAVLS